MAKKESTSTTDTEYDDQYNTIITTIESYSAYSTDSDSDSTASTLITATGLLNGIFGVPYQFMETVDRRITNSEVGRKYAEKIVARMPLLFLTPGKQVFMEDFSSDSGNNVLSALVSNITGNTEETSVSNLISGTGKYYSFEFDYSNYFNYVNCMCQIVAKYMGIGDEQVTIGNTTNTLGQFTWQNALSQAFKSFFDASENIVFYLDGLSSVSESFSNSTMESSLASTINGYSDTAKEIQFLLGGTDSVISKMLEGVEETTESITSGLSDVISKFDGDGIISSLAGSGVTSVLQGGKIIFPELWSDFVYDRSYSLDIKLRTPDHDSMSIYLNILVPYLHLLGLVIPREIADDPNAYSSPFLVKAFCKGLFNVDMGLITDMSVTKGAECCWNDDGLPTQIDISLTIKDLYSCLFMTGYSDHVKNIVNNTSMMDYLANMAGLNLAQMEMGRRTSMWIQLSVSKFLTTPSRIWTRFDNAITNVMYNLYQTI